MSSTRCSDASLQAGEPLAATATTAEHWLLVEVPGSWPRDVSDAESLSTGARAVARSWLDSNSRSRLLFVRRPGQTERPTLAFVVHAPEDGGSIRRFELDGSERLGDVDLATGGDVIDTRLVLVCGHGSRDPCCALKGTAMFGALADRLGAEELWISSHQGGHRFAPNLLVLPTGLHFGRVACGEAPSLVAGSLAGRIELSRYRGRTCYAPAVQAAERAVRAATGIDAVDELRLVDVDGSTVCFRDARATVHRAHVHEALGPPVPPSCGAEPEPQPVLNARVA